MALVLTQTIQHPSEGNGWLSDDHTQRAYLIVEVWTEVLTTQFKYQLVLKFRTTGGVDDTRNGWYIDGHDGDDVNIQHTAGGGITTLYTADIDTLNRRKGTGGYNYTFGAEIGDIGEFWDHNGDMQLNGWLWVPDQHPAPPAVPSNVKVTRTSDTRQKVEWAATTSGTTVYIERRRNAETTWVARGGATYPRTTFNDTTVVNETYEYRVYASNYGGVSSTVSAGIIATTPAIPTLINPPTRAGSVNTISWINNAELSNVDVLHEVWHASGAVLPLSWDVIPIATVSENTSSYQHTATPSLIHSYKVRTATPYTTVTTTATAGTNNIITCSAHGLSNYDPIIFTTLTGAAGLSLNTVYYVMYINANTFKVSQKEYDNTPAEIGITSAGSAMTIKKILLSGSSINSDPVHPLTTPLAPTNLNVGGLEVLDVDDINVPGDTIPFTWNHSSLDRTAQSKFVWRFKETSASDWEGQWGTTTFGATATIATSLFSSTAHGLQTGDRFKVSTNGGTLPTGITLNTRYYAIYINANTFYAAASYNNAIAGTKITFSGSSSGTHTITIDRINSGTSSFTPAAETLLNGKAYEWQVKTAGEYTTAPYWSPWSSSYYINTTTRPTTSITNPKDKLDVGYTAWGYDTLVVDWLYADAEGTPLLSSKIDVYNAFGQPLYTTETHSSVQTLSVPVSALKLASGYDYIVSVQTQDAHNMWSLADTNTFAVLYASPPTPTMYISVLKDIGAISIEVTNPVGTPAAINNRLWRSVDGGPYTLLETTTIPAGVPTAFIDYIPSLTKTNTYYVDAIAATGASSSSSVYNINMEDTHDRIWFNAGSDFSTRTYFCCNPSVSESFSLNKTIHHFAGRSKPVEFTGTNTDKTINVKGFVDLSLSSFESFESIINAKTPVCYRDCYGRRLFVSFGEISFDQKYLNYADFSAKLVEVDYDE